MFGRRWIASIFSRWVRTLVRATLKGFSHIMPQISQALLDAILKAEESFDNANQQAKIHDDAVVALNKASDEEALTLSNKIRAQETAVADGEAAVLALKREFNLP
jgi:hypothetical protein